MALLIKNDRCIGCGVCLQSCPFGALEITDGKATVLSSCTLCGLCVESCPVGAIEKTEREKPVAGDHAGHRGIWIFVQHDGSSIHPVTFELIGEGRRLADELGTYVGCLVMGANTATLQEYLAHYPVDRIYIAEHPVLEHYRTTPMVETAARAIGDFTPEILLIGATSTGRDFAGGLATMLKTGLTADCTDLAVEKETRSLLQTRPAFGGNIMATIKSSRHRPQMATVRPKVFPLPTRGEGREVDLIRCACDLDEAHQRTKVIGWKPSQDAVNIADANVIVSGGRGIGKPENFALLQEMADLLGGAVGATRGAVDADWIGYSHQVGQTGRTVRPRVYVACGVSGAVQHLAGMKTSDVIIAINRDPDAPIFSVLTLGYIGDVLEMAPLMIRELKRRLGRE